MTDVDQTPSDEMSAGSRPSDLAEHSRTGTGAPALQRAITDHLRYSIGRPAAALRPEHYYRALALAVRDRMQDRRVASTQTSLDLGLRRPLPGLRRLCVLPELPGAGQRSVAGQGIVDEDVHPEHRAQWQVIVGSRHRRVLRRHLAGLAADRDHLSGLTGSANRRTAKAIRR